MIYDTILVVKEGKAVEELDLIDLGKYFIKNLKIIVITTALTVILGTCYILFFQTPLYKSSTTLILVQSDNESEDLSLTQTEIAINQKLVSTYSEIIKSRRVMKQVIKNLKLDITIPDLSENITVSSVENTEIIKISVSDESNKKAAKIANEIAKVFSEEVSKIYKMENISVVDEAEVESIPYNIQIVKQEIIYFMVGFLLSTMILFIIFYFDTKIKTPEQIEEKLGLTVLGNIPKINVKKEGEF